MLTRHIFTMILLLTLIAGLLLFIPQILEIFNRWDQYGAWYDLMNLEFTSQGFQFILCLVFILIRGFIQYLSKNRASTKRINWIILGVIGVNFLIMFFSVFGEFRLETILYRHILNLLIYIFLFILSVKSLRIHRRNYSFKTETGLLDQE